MRILCLIPSLFITITLFSQPKGGFEQYQYLGAGTNNTIVPVLHFQSARGWYAEARYNYDEFKTFSLLSGKTFQLSHDGSSLITPMLGVAFGELEGFTTAINYSFEKSIFFFNAQTQYTFSANEKYRDFFFNWSEGGIQPLKWFYGGVSMQYTKNKGERGIIEPGVMAALSWKQISLPFYVFNTKKQDRFFILGLVWEWQKSP